ncbi:MAG TPA: four helix bundle protein [Rhodothermales bacterium]|nr:four helix bundle protein [Rhodothermales bacterium]
MNSQTKQLFERTLRFAIDMIAFIDRLPETSSGQTIARQLIRSASSIGANLREAQRARSRAEFLSRIQISLQEAGETEFWLQVILGSKLADSQTTRRLLDETGQLIAILASTIRTTKIRQGDKLSGRNLLFLSSILFSVLCFLLLTS